MDTVHIACASDDNFIIPLSVMLYSLLVNIGKDRKVIVYILTKNKENFHNNDTFNSLETECIDIKFLHINEDKYLNFPLGHITQTAYYRLSLPEVLPEELNKVIYLDCDLIINADIGKLWDMDIGQNYLLAVPEQGQMTQFLSSFQGGLSTYEELGLDPNARQFNSGVMVINLKKWREDNISYKTTAFLEKYAEKVKWWDQDALNAVLANKWDKIDYRWNILSQLFQNYPWNEGPVKDINKYKQLIKDPYIIHFNTSSKPWHKNNRHPYKYLFYHYYNMLNMKNSPKPWHKKNMYLYTHFIFFRAATNIPIRKCIAIVKKITHLLISLLKPCNISLFYYKHIYRKTILLSKPFICNKNSELEIHIVTSKNDFLDALWCLKTFYHYSGLRPSLVIHEDGTLSEDNINSFLKHFVNCRIIKREHADEDMQGFLSRYKNIQVFRAKMKFYCALKLLDTLHYSSTDKILLLDSDILFFKKPNEIIDYIKENKQFFNSDYKDAYAECALKFFNTLDIAIIPKINAGLMFINKEYYLDHLRFMDYYFEKIVSYSQPSDVNRHEQTLYAVLLSKSGAIRLNENYQISKTPITYKTISHHFVNDGSRNNFYTQGLKYLKKNKFLKLSGKS